MMSSRFFQKEMLSDGPHRAGVGTLGRGSFVIFFLLANMISGGEASSLLHSFRSRLSGYSGLQQELDGQDFVKLIKDEILRQKGRKTFVYLDIGMDKHGAASAAGADDANGSAESSGSSPAPGGPFLDTKKSMEILERLVPLLQSEVRGPDSEKPKWGNVVFLVGGEHSIVVKRETHVDPLKSKPDAYNTHYYDSSREPAPVSNNGVQDRRDVGPMYFFFDYGVENDTRCAPYARTGGWQLPAADIVALATSLSDVIVKVGVGYSSTVDEAPQADKLHVALQLQGKEATAETVVEFEDLENMQTGVVPHLQTMILNAHNKIHRNKGNWFTRQLVK
ncbi:unnamed protein product [Amoebophrya sp. A25]|nr:unnamed protein product [Amoebophrya sp. A25]|eukprot:GSA25T00008232001.1